jgi:CobQ-like glutamine amidotransferase family enzyme
VIRSPLVIAVVYPELLGTYGDGGNGLVLARRAAWRGLPVDLVSVGAGDPLPNADLYCLGGGEDGPESRAADGLARDGTLARAVAAGATVLAVCAGYQLMGHTFPAADGRPMAGLGLLDVTTVKGTGRRAVGEVVVDPCVVGGISLPPLTGFENHGGVTSVGPGARPLGRVAAGVGNGSGDRTEGAWAGRVVGSYLHGPLLARNPALADLLLEWATGDGPLATLDDERERALRAERMAAARRGGTSTLRRLLRLRGS